MSPSLLSTRLKALEHSGVVERNKTDQGIIYSLTDAGEELRSIVEKLGIWGQRWARSDMSKNELDPTLLMWDMRRRLDISGFPQIRTVLKFEYSGCTAKMRYWWLVIEEGELDVCLKDPGYDIHLLLKCSLKVMTQIWMGDVSLNEAIQSNALVVSGDTGLKKALPSWLQLNIFADVQPA